VPGDVELHYVRCSDMIPLARGRAFDHAFAIDMIPLYLAVQGRAFKVTGLACQCPFWHGSALAAQTAYRTLEICDMAEGTDGIRSSVLFAGTYLVDSPQLEWSDLQRLYN
jgi:hypothetical protein